MKLDRQRLHVVVDSLNSKVVPAANRVRRHGTSKLQDAVPDVGGPQCHVQGPAPLSKQPGGGLHPHFCREGDGVDLWTLAHGLALESCVDEGIDCVVAIARRGDVGVREVKLEMAGLPAWSRPPCRRWLRATGRPGPGVQVQMVSSSTWAPVARRLLASAMRQRCRGSGSALASEARGGAAQQQNGSHVTSGQEDA